MEPKKPYTNETDCSLRNEERQQRTLQWFKTLERVAANKTFKTFKGLEPLKVFINK